MILLAGYEISTVLHEGSGSILYSAVHTASGTPVVIKVADSRHPTASGHATIEHEYELLNELEIPGVVRTRGLEAYDSGTALILEYIPALSLSELLRSKRLNLRTCLEIALRVARVLASLHQVGVVHKDIKPGNILFNPETFELHIIDFGIAMRTSSEMQTSVRAEMHEGTLAYMSPEQTGRMNRVLDHRTDLYSLGVTLYECLIGHRPFTSEDPLSLIHSHVARLPPTPQAFDSSIPEPVSRLTMKLLAKTAEDRYQTAAGLVFDLEKCLNSLTEGGVVEDFPLAANDRTGKIGIPQKLFGRTAELSALNEAFTRTLRGDAQFVLVTGFSGIGKSALVREIHTPIASRFGFFAAGKFDQFNRATPYASIGAAFGSLVRLILSERAPRLAAWRKRLQDALGSNGQILLDLIPELVLVVGPQPPVPTLGPTESQNRFNLVFRRFIDAFANSEHPFVLFLDDLQWADPATLKLIQSLMSDRARRHFLLIGAYRDNEVDRAHPLALTLDALREAGVEPRTLRLHPLSLDDVGDLLAETLEMTPSACHKLAEIVYAKTNGNPFFVNQFVRALATDGLLRFDREAGVWRYNLDAVKAREYTDNVVDFMASKIGRLPTSVRDVLAIAACIGFSFDLQTLATILARSPEELHPIVWTAVQRGLLVSLDAEHVVAGALTRSQAVLLRYRFLHDRVQQAAYNLLASDERTATHLKIGRLLAAASTHDEQDSRLFEIVSHLNNGVSLISDPKERVALATRNLQAGRRAKAATAYEGAANYLRCGLTLLPEERWTHHYELCLDLYREFAECEYLCSRFDRAEKIFRTIISNVQGEIERADIDMIRLRLYQVAGRYHDGVDLAYEALGLLGMHFPRESDAINAAVGVEAEAIPKNLGDRSVASLIDAPRMTDPRQKRIMGLLAGLLPCAYIGQPEVFPLAALRMVNFSLQHGNTEESCFGYSAYGLMSVSVFGDIPRGHAFSTMSIALNERFDDATLRGTLLHLHGDHINFWSHHIQTGFPILERAFHACLEVGDLVYAGYLAFETVWQAIERGDTPEKVRQLAARYRTFAAQTKNDAVHETIRMQEQFLLFLEGQTDEQHLLNSAGFDEALALDLVTAASFGCGIGFLHIIKLIALYTRGRFVDALAAASAARPILGAVMAMPIEATFYFYEALTLLKLPEKSPDRIAEHLAKLELWAKHCPENYKHKLLLVRAELARVVGSPEAAALYDDAIESARENEFVQYQALGNELAGRYYHGLGRERIAPIYLNAAYVNYLRWGATGVAANLASEYPRYISVRLGPAAPRQHATPVTQLSATSTAILALQGAIDLNTILRATQAIVGEIDIERLVGTIMRLVLENAGGVSASLFFIEADHCVLAAYGTTEPDSVLVGTRKSLDECPDVAASIVRFVTRTRNVLVLSNAMEHPTYAHDPYIVREQVRSILCVPLLHRQKLTGVLYIENPSVKAAFTTERVALLEVLSMQAAGAMDNAQLYADIRSTSEELRRANERLEAEVAARTNDLVEVNEYLRKQLDEQKKSESSQRELHERIITMQRERILELATPIIPITDDIMVLPLVGTVDEDRAKRVLEQVLVDVRNHATRTLLIDLTGLRNVDANSVAHALFKTANALRLLGSETVLTGIGPSLAQALVELEIELGGLVTRGTLQDGIKYAMQAGKPAKSKR